MTILVWLNEDYEGGETHFPTPGLKLKGRTGDAILFRNTGADGRTDPASGHAGLPVTARREADRQPLDPGAAVRDAGGGPSGVTNSPQSLRRRGTSRGSAGGASRHREPARLCYARSYTARTNTEREVSA